MRLIERDLQDQTYHVLLAEDEKGLFVHFREGHDATNQDIQWLRTRPGIKWFRDFSNQKPDDPERGASEAVAAIFMEIRSRSIDLSPDIAQILNEELGGAKNVTKQVDSSPSR